LAVPAQLLSWHRLSLPRIAPGRWRAALDTLLEDRLLVEPAQAHLALGPGSQAGQEMLVAVCDKAWLSAAAQVLEQAGHSIVRIVPEFEPGAQRLHLQGHPEQAWLVHCSPDGVRCLPLQHPPRSSLLAWQSLLRAEGARLTAEPALVGLAEELRPGSSPLLSAGQALQQAADASWNLAQFELASRHGGQRLSRGWRRWMNDPAWRAARWGLAALATTHLLGLLAWAWKEERLLQEREQAVQAVLTRTFAQVQLVIDPVRQMERETALLAQARGQSGPADLPRMLAALASVAAVPRALEYQAGELSLSGWQPPADSDWKAALTRQGYRLEAVADRWVMRPSPEGAAP
jgi:general secretion pathway protein L